MKRLIILLIVLAGGLAAAAFAVPSNAATVDGVAISQQDLNSDLTAIANSPDYQCFLNAEQAVATEGQTGLPSVDGAGQVGSDHTAVTTGFAASYLDTVIGHQFVYALAAKRNLHVSAKDLSAARIGFTNQITSVLTEVAGSQYECGSGSQSSTAHAVLATMPSSFVAENVNFDATVSVLEEDVAGVGSSTSDLERYFDAHAAEFDTACFTVAEYSSQSDAQAAIAAVAAGTPFAKVASEAGGGPQGCDVLYGVAASLPAGSDLESLAVNAVSNPISVSGEYLVVQITSKSPTPFAKAETQLYVVAQNAGATKTGSLIDAAEKTANVWVDQRYGEWTPAHAEILPPTSPVAADVLNPSVNVSPSGTAKTTTPSTGQSS